MSGTLNNTKTPSTESQKPTAHTKYRWFLGGLALLVALLCGQDYYAGQSAEARRADAFISDYERVSLQKLGVDIALKPTTNESVHQRYKDHQTRSKEVRAAFSKELKEPSLIAKCFDPEKIHYLVFRALQLIAYGSILYGLIVWGIDSRLDALKEVGEAAKFGTGGRVSGAMAGLFLVGSTAAAVYIAGPPASQPPRGPAQGASAASIDALAKAVDLQSQETGKLAKSVGEVQQKLGCLQERTAGCAEAAPINVELGKDTKNMLERQARTMTKNVQDEVRAMHTTFSGIVLQRDVLHEGKLNTIVANELQARSALETRLAAESQKLANGLSKKLDADLKATTGLAARLTINRWAELTKGNPYKFAEANLATMDEVNRVNRVLDVLEDYRINEEWNIGSFRPLIPSAAQRCLRETMPTNPSASTCSNLLPGIHKLLATTMEPPSPLVTAGD